MVAHPRSPPAPTSPKISAIISAAFCTFIAAAAAIAKKITLKSNNRPRTALSANRNYFFPRRRNMQPPPYPKGPDYPDLPGEGAARSGISSHS